MTRSPLGLINDVPALKPILLLVGLALAVALGISLYMWSRGPDWTPLTTDLSASDAAAVTAALQDSGIPHRLGPAAGAVSVPRTQVHQARLLLAGTELPGTAAGFSMLSDSPGFGVSQFMESARYQYALETELARTISSLSPVRAARVHLAVARDSAFVRDSRRASASVVVDLRPGRSMDRAQAQSIINLVASSVPQMEADNVTVVDSNGNLLSGRASDGAADSAAKQFELARQTEALLAARIEGLLAPMLGDGRVRAQVTVEYETSSSEQASERVQPDPRAIRSERVRESTTGDGREAEGVPGAAANMPDNADAQNPAAAEERVRNRDVAREFEIGRELEFTRLPSGRLKRVSAAVLVDHITVTDAEGVSETRALTDDEMGRIERLVQGAIGFDAERGDRLSVDNSPFMRFEIPPAPEAPPAWERMIDDGWLQMAARNFGGVFILLILIFAVLRPTLRALLQPVTVHSVDDALVADGPRLAAPPAQDEGAIEVREAPYERQLQAARKVVQEDPKRVAQLVRTWVGNDG